MPAPNIISITPWSIYLKSFKNKYTPNIINTIPIMNITFILLFMPKGC